MNILKILDIETEGLCNIIKDYSGEPYISNILDKLKIAVKKNDLEEILYLLKKVDDWYNENILKIKANEFVFNFESHLINQENVKKYIRELTMEMEASEDIINIKDSTILEENNMGKKIFISHSSEDKQICTAFVELLETIGIPEDKILYTSSSRHGIPGDYNIFEYLRKNLSQEITVFYMLSDNYYRSAYCLNEMGATWITQNNFSIFLLPNFDGEIKGVIDKNKKGYKLSDSIELISLKNRLQQQFNCTVSEYKWEEAKNKFLSVVNNLI